MEYLTKQGKMQFTGSGRLTQVIRSIWRVTTKLWVMQEYLNSSSFFFHFMNSLNVTSLYQVLIFNLFLIPGVARLRIVSCMGGWWLKTFEKNSCNQKTSLINSQQS